MAAQGGRQRIIERRHGQRADRFGPMPGDRRRLPRVRDTLPCAAGVKKNDKRAALPDSRVRRGSETAGEADGLERAQVDRHAQFLLQFTNCRDFSGFARFDLAPRKFP